MAKLQLTIASDYCPTWGIYEGVRELIQNSLDSQDDGHPMVIKPPTEARPVLSIINTGACLDRATLLLGVSSKQDSNHRGQYGEGLKIGTLALVRAGRKVTVVNDYETWTASLEESRDFGRPVLTITTRQRTRRAGEFRVEVELTPAEWADYGRNFRALQPLGKVITTSNAEILLDPGQRGRLYVKGILVEEREGLTAGYDFLCASTDRDRRMIYSWEFSYYTANAWANGYLQGAVTAKRLLELLTMPTPDIQGMGESSMPQQLIDDVAEVFRQTYGQLAVPVRSLAEQAEAGHLGRDGIIAGETLCGLLCSHPELSLEDLRSQCRGEVVATYSTADLDSRERGIYVLGTALVEAAGGALGYAALEGRLAIVDFRADDILGLSQMDRGAVVRRISVARRNLDSLESYIRVLVHELAHDRGGDGDASHERAEGELFCRIISRSLDGFVPAVLRNPPVPVAAAA